MIVKHLTTLGLVLCEYIARLLKLLLDRVGDLRLIRHLVAETIVQQTMENVIDALHLTLVLISTTALVLLILLLLNDRSWRLHADKIFDSSILFHLRMVQLLRASGVSHL